jgi:hypothetical protein
MILAGLLAAALGTGSLCAADKTLTGDEVRALFSGKTVDYVHVTRGFRMSVYYADDGSMNDKGELCIEYGKGDRCRHIVEEDGEYRKYKEENGEKLHIVTYHTFTDGNPNNY